MSADRASSSESEHYRDKGETNPPTALPSSQEEVDSTGRRGRKRQRECLQICKL